MSSGQEILAQDEIAAAIHGIGSGKVQTQAPPRPDEARQQSGGRGRHAKPEGCDFTPFEHEVITSFIHTLETLLDELCCARMQVTTYIADQLFLSVDVLRAMLRPGRGKEPVDTQRVADLQFDLEAIVAGKGSSAPAAPSGSAGVASGANPRVGVVAGAEPVDTARVAPVTGGGWEIGFRVLAQLSPRGSLKRRAQHSIARHSHS